jgi:IS30 family transposase
MEMVFAHSPLLQDEIAKPIVTRMFQVTFAVPASSSFQKGTNEHENPLQRTFPGADQNVF